MAKKKSGKKGGVSVTIRNAPARKKNKKPHKKKGGGHHKKKNPKGGRRRRRRNPDTFMSRLMSLGAVAGVAVLSGVVVTVVQAKVKPGSALSLYGAPVAMAVGGALLAKHAPTIGAGMVAGSFSPFVLPVASRALTGSSPTAGAAQTAAAAVAGLEDIEAVEMGDEFYHALNAVTMGAVEMGGQHAHMAAVEMGDEDDDDDYVDDEDELYDDAAYG